MSQEELNALSNPSSNSLVNVPDFMREDRQLGTEDMTKFIIPPRLVIVQPLSNAPLDKYAPGTPVIMPSEVAIGTFDKADMCLAEPMIGIPVFFFPEWTIDNPHKLKKQLGAIRDRTFDPESELALRAQNPKLREFPCPEDPNEKCKYVTRLHFIVYMLSAQIPEPVIITFKSAEMRSGMALNSLIKARKAPIFGCKFAFDIGFRSNDKGKWYGIDCSNPPENIGGWVDNSELYQTLKEEHLKFKAAHESKLIQPDFSDEGNTSSEPVEF